MAVLHAAGKIKPTLSYQQGFSEALRDRLDRLQDFASCARMADIAYERVMSELTYERVLGAFHDNLRRLI